MSFRINIGWNNNSCYIDSLLVGLLYNTDVKYLTTAKIRDYKDKTLLILGNKIRNNIIRIVEIINNSINDSKNEIKDMRYNLNEYYKRYRSINKRINIIETNDNWINSQIDIFELFEFLQIIFEIKPTMILKEGNDKINKIFDYMIPIDLLINKDEVKLRDIIPKYKIIYKLDKNNPIINNKGKKIYKYKNTIEIIKTDKIFVKIYRNIGLSKLRTKIRISNSIKIKDNKDKLYVKSMIIHYGTKDGGHYIALIKRGNKWYEYDDMKSEMKYIGKLIDINKNNRYKENIVGLLYE
jgi:hypothetical protein